MSEEDGRELVTLLLARSSVMRLIIVHLILARVREAENPKQALTAVGRGALSARPAPIFPSEPAARSSCLSLVEITLDVQPQALRYLSVDRQIVALLVFSDGCACLGTEHAVGRPCARASQRPARTKRHARGRPRR